MVDSNDLYVMRQRLEARLSALGPFALAFSGGLDSRFLAHVALGLGLDVRAVHASGVHIPAGESKEARAWAASRGLPLTEAPVDVLALSFVAAGARDRCYHCKNALFKAITRAVPDPPLCDGTNASDLTHYRPGIKALKERGVVSPLAESGLTKTAVHALAARMGLDRPDQTARPCLLTRFNYGLPPDAATLARIDAAETAIAVVFARHTGTAPDYRLRVTAPGEHILQIALPDLSATLRQDLGQALADQGFGQAAIMPVDTVSGFFDRQAAL